MTSDFESDLREGRLTPVECVSAFNRVMQRAMPELYMVSMDDLEALSNGLVNHEGLERLIPYLSYRIGDLRHAAVEHLTFGNPAWTRPFIALEGGAFLCPNPAMGPSHLLDLVGHLVSDEDNDADAAPDAEPEARKRWSRARARFLEQETQRVLATGFPSSNRHCRDHDASA